jgi:hypothetical protein
VRHIKSKSLFLALAASFSLNASATLLNPLEYQQGSTTWLKWSETVGLSINDIESGVGGWNTYYRFATTAEITDLLASLNLVTTNYTAAMTPIGYFMEQIAGYTEEGYTGTWFSQGNAGAMGRSHEVFVSTHLTSGDWQDALSPDCPAYTNCSAAEVLYQPQALNSAHGAVGNFLVRRTVDVPEPGSFALLGIAGILLAARRRVTARVENSRA